jgi:hypothetical protein
MKCDNCEALAAYKHDPKIANVAFFCAPHLPVNLRSAADNYMIAEAPAPTTSKKKSTSAPAAEETASDE